MILFRTETGLYNFPKMDTSDVELESENSQTSSPRPARKNITLKLKTEKPGRGRPRKSKTVKHEEPDPASTTDDEVLDTPIFKTMEPGEPIHHNKKLKWDHKVNLLGEKVVDPLIHCCSLCSLPILIYGRMIQCKHVFCFTCAKKTEKTCPRCGDPVQRIEQSALGTVFLCTYGGTKHGSGGCRRTYLSQRDLNAHIGHRHLKSEIKEQAPAQKAQVAVGAATAQGKSALAMPANVPNASSHVSPTSQSHQALLDQFMRQVSAVTGKLPARSAQDAGMYHSLPGGGPAAAMSHMQHTMAVSSAHQLAHPQQHTYAPSSVLPSMSSLPGSQPVISHAQPLATSSVSQDNYTSAIPVVGSRIQTLISVPLQEDDYAKKHAAPKTYQPHTAQTGLPNMNFPPPFPVGSLAPNIHQPPPSVGLPMYSSPLPTPSYSNPPPQIITTGPPRVPQRLGAPPPGAPPRFFEAQAGRGTWSGPPRGPSGPPPRGPPRADYNYY